MARRAAITYDGLPVSSGGAHKLRGRGFQAGLLAVQSFIQAVPARDTPSDLTLEVIAGDDVPSSFSGPLVSVVLSTRHRGIWRCVESGPRRLLHDPICREDAEGPSGPSYYPRPSADRRP